MSSAYPYPYPYPVAPSRLPLHPRANTAMVLGLVGVVGFFLVVPLLVCPLAWYYGAVADRETEREPTRYREGSEARTGMVMGIVGSAMLTLFLFLLFVVGALTLLSSHYDAGYGT